jgi:S-adenosylmethionine/arginine decarboxylase-like enzyme
MQEVKSWGYHLIANFGQCDLETIMSEQAVIDFTKELVQAIDMVAYGEPQVVNFGTGNKAGFTLVQLIETSNICAHFCNEDGSVYLDVFSCKTFDPDIALQVFKKYFNPKTCSTSFLTRQALKI